MVFMDRLLKKRYRVSKICRCKSGWNLWTWHCYLFNAIDAHCNWCAPVQLRDQAVREKRGPALADKVIVLDPSSRSDIADLTFDLAQKIEGRLIALGVSVFLTRSATSQPTPQERIAFANNTEADLVISLDIDKYRNEKAQGLSTYFYGSDSHGIHSIVGERFATIVQRELIARTDLLNTRTHAKTWDILRLTKAPTVLLELVI